MVKIPAYRRVYADLRKMIKGGDYPPGSYLPSETELEQIFDTSRTTIRKAVSILAAEKFVSLQQGRGTKVLDVSTTQKLNCITSLTETLSQRGFTVSTQGISVEKIKADEDVAEALKINTQDDVYHVQRVQCADGKPIAIMENYLCAKMLPNFENNDTSFLSLYSLLEQQYGITISEAYQTITAINANFTESQILQIPIGSPLLVSKRVVYSNNVPLDYSTLRIIAEKYSYSIYLSGR